MKNTVKSLTKEISSELYKSAMAYFQQGLKIFHKSQKSQWIEYQPAIGNLCISIELLLKSIIAQKSIRDLFVNLPAEAKLYLSNPELIPDATSIRTYTIDLKSYKYKTLEFDKCISYFYIFYPKHKQKFRPYLSFISRVRNLSVHASIPQFQKYDLHRVVYISLELFNTLNDSFSFNVYTHRMRDENDKFLAAYSEDRIERVHKNIESSKEKTKKLNHTGTILSIDSWEEYVTKCPVCGSDGVLYGYTDYNVEEGEDEIPEFSLDFYADSFECLECRLELKDYIELDLAGMGVVYDRSFELDNWFKEFGASEFD